MRMSGYGVRNRIRALHAIGWSFRAISDLTGVCPSKVNRLAHDDAGDVRIEAATLARVADAYRRALASSGPPLVTHQQVTGSRRARERAAALGWRGPLDYPTDRHLDRRESAQESLAA